MNSIAWAATTTRSSECVVCGTHTIDTKPVISRLLKRNNAPLANSVVGDELVGKVGVALEPLVAHGGRIALEDEGGTIGRIGVGADHEHGSLGVQLLAVTQRGQNTNLSETEMTRTERGSLLENSLDVVV